MQIQEIKFNLLSIPTTPARASATEIASGRNDKITTLVVKIRTKSGIEGIGFAYSLQGGGKAMLAIGQEDLAPLIINENALDNEKLASKVYWRTQTIGRTGLVQQVYSAIDVALWDIKGKAAKLPLHKLLGGFRESIPAYISHTGWLWMSVGQIIDLSKPFLEQGVMGLKVKVGANPQNDIERISNLREAMGENIWLAVDANERYDTGTALAMGNFYQDEIGVGWFEEPITCENIKGHSYLANNLDIPIASGEMLFSREEFHNYLEKGAMDIAQPDITRLGGITNTLKVIHYCESQNIPVSPHLLPELAVHLGCGLPQITSVEYMPWFEPLFNEYPKFKEGKLIPPEGPGLGLSLSEKAINEFIAS